MKTPLVCLAYILTLAPLFACGSKPSPPGRLENVGGSSGREPDASTSGGSAGSGAEPTIDAGTNPPGGWDAGADAALPDADAGDAGADADAPGVEVGCVIDSLEVECAQGRGCPDLDEAASWLLADDAVEVVRRPCEGADGTRYITVGGGFGLASKGYIYDAESSALVSTYATNDVPDYCSETTPSAIGFHGRVIQDCVPLNPNDATTPCDGSPSGPGGGGPGNGGPGGPGSGADPSEECIYPPG